MPDPKDQRASQRFPPNGNSGCDFASPVLEDFGPVRLKNLCLEGVGLIVPERLEPGLLLAVNLVNQAKGFSRTYLVRVVHSTVQPGGTYLIGGTFANPLTYEELCMFVM